MNTILILALLALLVASVLGYALNRAKLKNTKFFCNAANPPNSGRHSTGHVTRLSDGAITQFHLVKVGTDEDHVAVSAGATDVILGIAEDEAGAAEENIDIAVLGAISGTQFCIATGVIANGALIQSNGDGTVKTAVSNGFVIGRALQASGATGDRIEFTPCLTAVALA